MKIRNKILTSLLFGSLYATSASAGLSCEYIGGVSLCEAVTANQMSNTYTWSTSGNASVSSNGGAFATATCYGGGFPTCMVHVTVMYPNGSTSNWSKSIQPTSGGSGGTGLNACSLVYTENTSTTACELGDGHLPQ